MATLDTFSTFYLIDPVTVDNRNIPFDEGGPELNAQITIGGFSPSEITTQIATALNAVGGNVYTVSFDRNTRIYTISADGVFDLLLSTGATVGQSIFTTLGFNQGVDLTGLTSYSGDTAAGIQYDPQFRLQSFVDKEEDQELASASVNQAADGSVEAISFGRNKFYSMDIKFITDSPGDCFLIKTNATGVSDAQTFFQAIIDKRTFEFMKDIDDPATFDRVIVERLPGSRTGTGFRLRELVNRGLRGYFELNGMRLRVVE